MNEEKKYSIYTDVDAILDTRFVTYGVMDIDKIEELQKRGFSEFPYFYRITEYTELFDQTEYNEAYRNRDKKFLSAAQPTDIMTHIVNMLGDVAFPGDRPIVAEYGDIILNTWPYDLTEVEERMLVSDILGLFPIPSFTEIHTINRDPSTINQQYIKDKDVRAIVSYSGDEILASLIENYSLETNRLPKVCLVIPAISKAPDVTVTKLYSEDSFGYGPFGFIEMAMGELIEVKHLDGHVFSAVLTEPLGPQSSSTASKS